MPRHNYVSRVTKRFAKVEAFHPERLTQGDPYSLQNILLKQVNFPSEIRKGEHLAEFWADKLAPEVWVRAFSKLNGHADHPALWIPNTTPESFLAMAQSLVGKKFKVTGAAIIRYTDSLNTKPILRIIAVGIPESRRSYNNNDGPHIDHEHRFVNQVGDFLAESGDLTRMSWLGLCA